MSNRLPVEINPFRLVEQRRQISGFIPLKQMPRLLEVAEHDKGGFTTTLNFTLSESHLPMVSGQVKGTIALQCQRCLEAVEVQIDYPLNTVFVRSDRDQRPEQEGYDLWLVEDDDRLFLRDFVEDEVLLALPLIARHADCQLQFENEMNDAGTIQDKPSEVDEKDNPFAILKNWKNTE